MAWHELNAITSQGKSGISLIGANKWTGTIWNRHHRAGVAGGCGGGVPAAMAARIATLTCSVRTRLEALQRQEETVAGMSETGEPVT